MPSAASDRRGVAADDDALAAIARHASGDARVALNLLELAATLAGANDRTSGSGRIDRALLAHAVQKRALLYDKSGEQHFDLISALHKSLRNSDPRSRCRRLLAGAHARGRARNPAVTSRAASYASPPRTSATPTRTPWTVTVAAKEAVHFVGMPEGNTALAQAVTYLAAAPKSNAVYAAYSQAAADAHEQVAEPVSPPPAQTSPTPLMKDQGHGRGYSYAHDDPDGVTGMDCLPPALAGAPVLPADGAGLRKGSGPPGSTPGGR